MCYGYVIDLNMLRLSHTENKIMHFNSSSVRRATEHAIRLNGVEIHQCGQFHYLGSIIQSDGNIEGVLHRMWVE
uniref:Uncharacterized protein n=1 Tax=Rhizophora mucronata TaxID=61149 RepID=A0A2P2QT27_RHIMU